MSLIEVQVDRLVGPTHHFGGLGVGNLASQVHAGQHSNPRAAALQGLDKMRLVASLGVPQLILPPQPRPCIDWLRRWGFTGSEAEILRRCGEESPALLSAVTSCSAMWTANAATVTPGMDRRPQARDASRGDTADDASDRTEVTIANLIASLHRAIEPQQTLDDLRRVLPAGCLFHDPLPGGAPLRDEGAANHMRLAGNDATPGINLFVHGDGGESAERPRRHWPRQTAEASRAIARLHALPRENTYFLQQDPRAIDAGAFHNDVLAISHRELLIHHELAFRDGESTLQRIEARFRQSFAAALKRVVVPQSLLSVDEAVATYLFNSQVVSRPMHRDSPPILICPAQVEQHRVARALVQQWCERGLFDAAHFVDLSQSMSAGGGPACLRLRVPLPSGAVAALASPPLWSPQLDQQLRLVIDECYASRLSLSDLADADFHAGARQARERIAEVLAPIGDAS